MFYRQENWEIYEMNPKWREICLLSSFISLNIIKFDVQFVCPSQF